MNVKKFAENRQVFWLVSVTMRGRHDTTASAHATNPRRQRAVEEGDHSPNAPSRAPCSLSRKGTEAETTEIRANVPPVHYTWRLRLAGDKSFCHVSRGHAVASEARRGRQTSVRGQPPYRALVMTVASTNVSSRSQRTCDQVGGGDEPGRREDSSRNERNERNERGFRDSGDGQEERTAHDDSGFIRFRSTGYRRDDSRFNDSVFRGTVSSQDNESVFRHRGSQQNESVFRNEGSQPNDSVFRHTGYLNGSERGVNCDRSNTATNRPVSKPVLVTQGLLDKLRSDSSTTPTATSSVSTPVKECVFTSNGQSPAAIDQNGYDRPASTTTTRDCRQYRRQQKSCDVDIPNVADDIPRDTTQLSPVTISSGYESDYIPSPTLSPETTPVTARHSYSSLGKTGDDANTGSYSVLDAYNCSQIGSSNSDKRFAPSHALSDTYPQSDSGPPATFAGKRFSSLRRHPEKRRVTSSSDVTSRNIDPLVLFSLRFELDARSAAKSHKQNHKLAKVARSMYEIIHDLRKQGTAQKSKRQLSDSDSPGGGCPVSGCSRFSPLPMNSRNDTCVNNNNNDDDDDSEGYLKPQPVANDSRVDVAAATAGDPAVSVTRGATESRASDNILRVADDGVSRVVPQSCSSRNHTFPSTDNLSSAANKDHQQSVRDSKERLVQQRVTDRSSSVEMKEPSAKSVNVPGDRKTRTVLREITCNSQFVDSGLAVQCARVRDPHSDGEHIYETIPGDENMVHVVVHQENSKLAKWLTIPNLTGGTANINLPPALPERRYNKGSVTDVSKCQQTSATDVSKCRLKSAADVSKCRQTSATDVSKRRQTSATEVSKCRQTSTTDVLKCRQTSATEVSKCRQTSATDVLKCRQTSTTDVSKRRQTSATDVSKRHQTSATDISKFPPTSGVSLSSSMSPNVQNSSKPSPRMDGLCSLSELWNNDSDSTVYAKVCKLSRLSDSNHVAGLDVPVPPVPERKPVDADDDDDDGLYAEVIHLEHAQQGLTPASRGHVYTTDVSSENYCRLEPIQTADDIHEWSSGDILNYIDGFDNKSPKRRENILQLLGNDSMCAKLSESLEIETKLRHKGLLFSAWDEDDVVDMVPSPEPPSVFNVRHLQPSYV